MASHSTRRDPRRELPRGRAFVLFELEDATPLRGDVTSISATGLAFTLADKPPIEAGTFIVPAEIRIDGTVIQGDLNVRYTIPVEGPSTEVGCLFYPASLEDAGRWRWLLDGDACSASEPTPRLAMRCAACQAAVWIEDSDEESQTCVLCEQAYGLDRPIRGSRMSELHLQSRNVAAELSIDTPSAVSFVLGTLSLVQIRDLLDDPREDSKATEQRDKAHKRHFDPAFAPAIEAGTLTEDQAIQRGSREGFARKLVARHRIRLTDAYDVTDNKTSLLQLLRARGPQGPIRARFEEPKPRGVSRGVVLAVVVSLLVIVLARRFDRTVNASPEETSAPASTRPAEPIVPHEPVVAAGPERPVDSYARVQRSDGGRLLRIEAADPGDVLLAFCKSTGAERMVEPVRVVETDPPSDEVKIGVVRDLARLETYHVVVIRRDPETSLWYLANKSHPDAGVSTFPASDSVILAAETSG